MRYDNPYIREIIPFIFPSHAYFILWKGGLILLYGGDMCRCSSRIYNSQEPHRGWARSKANKLAALTAVASRVPSSPQRQPGVAQSDSLLANQATVLHNYLSTGIDELNRRRNCRSGSTWKSYYNVPDRLVPSRQDGCANSAGYTGDHQSLHRLPSRSVPPSSRAGRQVYYFWTSKLVVPSQVFCS